MNDENETVRRTDGGPIVSQEVQRIRREEVRAAIKKMKSGKTVRPDDIPIKERAVDQIV